MTWIFKAAGAAVMLISASLMGRSLMARRRAVTTQISGFLRVFRALRSGISHENAPIGDILARLDGDVLRACSGNGGAASGDTLGVFCASCVMLSEGLARLTENASRELGRGYREEQIAACDRYIEALEAQHRESVARQREQTGLVGRLMMIGAAGAVILLI